MSAKDAQRDSQAYKDELEASNNVSVLKFKQWLLKSYIDNEHFFKTIEADINTLLSQRTISESHKDIIMQYAKSDPYLFIDFMVKDGVVIYYNLACKE